MPEGDDPDLNHDLVKPRLKFEKVPNVKKDATWFYLGLVGQFGLTITLPIVGGALLGSYLDRRLNSYPKATLSLLFFGTLLSIIQLIQTVKEIIKTKT